MTDRLALYLALGAGALIAGDLALDGGAGTLFLLRRFMELLDWVEFWR